MNQETYFGHNAIQNLQDVLNKLSPRSILLVTGKNSFQSSGAQLFFERMFNKYQFHFFNDFEQNPRLEDVEKGIMLFDKYRCDLIIAVGGGSVIDMAKLINCFQANRNYLDIALNNEEVKHNGVKLIAVPTTSGSGSESTHFAVLYINTTKYSIEGQSILPNISIIDPQLSSSLTPYITAVTGLDAFSQSVESYWSINSTSESISFAEQALKIIWENLYKAVHMPDNESRTMMSLGSNLAGKAINITKTTAPHALSYILTARYNIPHGHAVALFLPYFFQYNMNVSSYNCNDVRGYEYVQDKIKSICDLLNIKAYGKIRQDIQNYIKSLGVENNFKNLNLTYEDISFILDNVNQKRLKNNPRLFEKDQLMKIIFQ